MPPPVPTRPDWLPPGKELDELTQDDWVEFGMVVGGRFLINGRGQGDPRPNINAYLAQWRREFGQQNMSQQDARAAYARQFTEMEALGVFQSEFDPDYVDAADAIEAMIVAVDLLPSHNWADLPSPV